MGDNENQQRSMDQLKRDRQQAYRSIKLLHNQFLVGTQVDIDIVDAQFHQLHLVEDVLNQRGEEPTKEEAEIVDAAAKLVYEMKNREPADLWSDAKSESSSNQSHQQAPAAPASPSIKDKLNKFDGNFLKFGAFRLSFDDLVHNNPTYDDRARQRLLVNHLDGDAYEVISSFIGQQNAYRLMYQALMKEYTEPDRVKDHLKQIINKLKSMSGPTDPGLATFKTKVEQIRASVNNVIAQHDDFRQTVYKLIIKKFSGRYSVELVEKCSTLDQLIIKFDKWIKATERKDLTGQSSKEAHRDPKADKKKFKSATAKAESRCAFCSNGHQSRDCQADVSPSERRRLVAEKRLCFLCLEKGHGSRSPQCPMKGQKCAKCQRWHHPSICSPPPPQPHSYNTGPTVNSGAMYAREPAPLDSVYNVGALMFESFVDNSPYLRATLNSKSVRILLDTGSDKTFIARHLLHSRDVFRGVSIVVTGIGGHEPCDEVTRFYLAGPGIAPIGFYAYVLNQLPNTDIIIGRFDIPLLLKNDEQQNRSGIFDTVFGPVRFDQPEAVNRVSASRAAFTSQAIDLNKFIKEIAGDEPKESDFELNIRQLANGRYCAKLPFLPGNKPSNNYLSTKRRLDRLQVRLLKSPGQLDKYEHQLMQYVQDGHAIKLMSLSSPWSGPAYYMPHREVIREDSETTKLRIVFDCGSGKPSLNDRLYKGDAESLKLFENLLQFRLKPVAVIADISKAFLQIEIDKADQRYLRFLWKRDAQIEVYQMTRLPFGLVTSPAILLQAIQLQIEKYRHVYPETTAILSRAFYMDDLITSVESIEEAMKLKVEASAIFGDAHFPLAKWSPNVTELMQAWDSSRVIDLLKVLGLMWNLKDDTLSVRIDWKPSDEPLTPRMLMQMIGTIFDPLGFTEPVKLLLKELFREACKVTKGWDAPIPQHIAQEVAKIEKKLPSLTMVQFPRHVPSPTIISLFCDASSRGYGFIVCLTDKVGRNYFLYAKSRLAPTKKERTIPELELAALTEAVQNVPLIRRYYDQQDANVVIWSDSSITLSRLGNDINKYGPYVGNRLLHIHRVCEQFPMSFRYVPTKLNPADAYSRPKTVDQYLKVNAHQLELDIKQLLEAAEDCELPKVDICYATQSTPKKKQVEPVIEIPGYESISDWGRMVNRTYWLIRFTFLKLKYQHEVTVQHALVYLFRQVQSLCIDSLQTEVGSLPTEYDEFGVIRVRTRNVDDRPIWVPQGSRVALMLVRHYHVEALHMRRRFTKALLHERFFIKGINRLVDRVMRTCVECQKNRHSKGTIVQPTGDLPPFRTKPYLPFECVGVDYFGPVKLGNNRKVWVLITTCSVSRAVHLEVVNNLSADACLDALNATFTIRGLPRIVVSDNGTNFVRVEKDLRRLQQLFKQSAQMTYNEFDLKWTFNPPRAPWWGGFFERMVGTVKKALGKLSNLKNIDQLRRLLVEAMSVVNSRPLFPNDSETDNCITPGHYLIGRSYKSIPRGSGKCDSFKSLNYAKDCRRRFVKFWKSEYLRQLSLQYQNATKVNLKEGDLVLISEPDDSEDWKLARIETVEKGPDDTVRQVTVLFPESRSKEDQPAGSRRRQPRTRKILMRTAQNLVKLELDQPPGGECHGMEEAVSHVIYGLTSAAQPIGGRVNSA